MAHALPMLQRPPTALRLARPALRVPPPRGRRAFPPPRAGLDPDNASILVCGGGGVALEVTRRLKDMGAWVWQLQRTDVRRKEIEGMMAIVVKGDALEQGARGGEGGAAAPLCAPRALHALLTPRPPAQPTLSAHSPASMAWTRWSAR